MKKKKARFVRSLIITQNYFVLQSKISPCFVFLVVRLLLTLMFEKYTGYLFYKIYFLVYIQNKMSSSL